MRSISHLSDYLGTVAQSQIYLEGEHADSNDESGLHKKVHHIVGKIHTLVSKFAAAYHTATKRRVYTTPKSYLSFLAVFKELYRLKVEETNAAQESLMLGLEKMNSAKADIDKMKEELKQKQQDLYQSQLETEALVAEIKLSKGMTEQERTKVEKIVSDVTAKVRTVVLHLLFAKLASAFLQNIILSIRKHQYIKINIYAFISTGRGNCDGQGGS